jgi:HK97 family phage portal protein
VGLWNRLFGANGPTSAPIEAQISQYVANRLATLDIWGLPTVVAGRTLTADVVATMPMVATSGTTRIRPTPAVLRRPDPREAYRVTIEKIVNQLSRHGACWYRIYQTGVDGWPLAIRVIDRPRVAWQLSSTGDEVTDVWIDGVKVPDPISATVRYIPFRSDPGPPGTSPLQDVQDALEQLVAVYEYQAAYYGNPAPPYALKHPQRQTTDQADAFMAQWEAARAKRRPAFLSGGVELEQYNPVSAADALLLDEVNYLDAVAARVQLIPPSLLNVEAHSSLTYATTLDELRRWLTLTLMPGYLARIEASFSDLLPRGQTATFDTSALLRMDFAARIATYAESIAAGIHSVGEVRALEGLPPTPAAQPEPVNANVEGL